MMAAQERTMGRRAPFALIVCVFATSVFAQGLGDAARKETQRRSRAKGSGKVYTGDDLRHDGSSTAPEPPPAVAETEATSSSRSEGASQNGQDERRWRSRADSLRGSVSRLEREVDEADRVATRLAYDGPMDGGGYVNTEHTRWVARVQKAREALASARKALEDFEEEARRAGIPPGWLR
jgi:hypothetical protein